MPDISIDAIKIAKSIQKDELDILRGKEFKFRDKIKKRKRMKKTRKKNKYTLNEIGDALFEFIKTTNKRFDWIDARLDYIVSANNLKDLSKNKKI